MADITIAPDQNSMVVDGVQYDAWVGGPCQYCDLATTTNPCLSAPCTSGRRADMLSVVFIRDFARGAELVLEGRVGGKV